MSNTLNRKSLIAMDDLYIKLDNTTIYGKLAGDPAAPLLLGIHGWSQRNGWHTWEPLLDPLGAAGFCVVSVDMPGWGRSPSIDALPLMGERAETVVLGIMDGLQKETAVLLGKSWGGGVALTTTLSNPERITKLILTAPAFRDLNQLQQLTQPVLLAWAKDDPVIPYDTASQYLNTVPNIDLITYETGGHSAAPKNANDFAPKAIEFLR
ncbi:MAG: alpha/beta hydrolase [Chloroflexi bacterium]|nr:alpha/beta hydrolase [Chloroflexota bacterium]